MEWLEQNLSLAFPFDDQVTDSIVGVFADALISAGAEGPYTLEIFSPQGLTNALVQVKKGSDIILDTGSATVTVLGDWLILEGTDTVHGSSYRFIVDPDAILIYPELVAPVTMAPAACAFNGQVVSSINGLSGDVILSMPDHSQLTITDQTVSVGFAEPEDRVDCATADCEKVFTINGQAPDQYGSFTISPDGCYRLVPHPEDAGKVLLFNLCVPCLDCDNVLELDAKFTSQADYYHQLAAIYHDQFNRFQKGVAKANREIVEAQTRGIVTSNGLVDVSGRSFTRPYFSQLSLAILNSTPYHISIDLSVTITPTNVSNQLTYLTDSSTLQRFQVSGNQFTSLAALPGDVTVTLDPQEQVAVSTEVQRTGIDDTAPSYGTWHVVATVTFVSGPGTLPASGTLTRDYALEIKTGA